MKFLDKNGLDIVLSAVKSYTDTKVANRTYKVSINGTNYDLKSDSQAVNLGTYLTAHQSLDNYYTKSGTDSAINAAIGKLTKFDLQVVSQLPSTGITGTIYLVAHNHSDSNDIYDEYIWNAKATTPAFEKIGNTDVDLSGYVNSVEKSGAGTFLTGVSKSGNKLTFTTGSVTQPNSFGKVTVGSATVASSSSSDTFELKAGNNVSLSASGKVITISSSYTNTDTDHITKLEAGNLITVTPATSGLTTTYTVATSATADSAIDAGKSGDASTAETVYGALAKAGLA